MRFSACLRGFAAMLPALMVLWACTVVVEEPRPGPRPGFCTREFQPVCARRFGEQRTFANACLADRAGYDIIRRGECRSEQRFCPMDYRPVCATSQGRVRTFGNACEADAAGWRVISNRRC